MYIYAGAFVIVLLGVLAAFPAFRDVAVAATCVFLFFCLVIGGVLKNLSAPTEPKQGKNDPKDEAP